MLESFSDIETRARKFAEQAGAVLDRQLGYGLDGSVWETNRQSALKSFGRQSTYERERDCYRRLFENNVRCLAGLDVPLLLDYSDRFWVIEMTLVQPPCILDFGKAYVDQRPDYSPEALAEAEAAERELFSDDE